ncbi:lipase ROG1 family protein [Aspergillus mulundensis]|uniref:DUF676 domain-containing protein n=1 Tax=Aspergillus mulundensis TaxID=1810919 RepID=A0A3D8SCC1_9EURO|nr:Uncharacterized protein DSM5745_04306 [Aspergillus mulundensis]RDW83980.1 Uncharacterized protein DSM5745_04306 [Aspergillus mulundensis]
MLITPRTYSASQTLDGPSNSTGNSKRLRFSSLTGWHAVPTDADHITEMPLIWQAGSVRVGEVIRPAADETQPPPAALHVKVRNTSAIPLRAAYLHGPYTLYASCYPCSFDPSTGIGTTDASDVPQFEPYLKAGGTWNAVIPVPVCRQQGDSGSGDYTTRQETTWIIEIISQVIFSSTASVNFEIVVGRNEMSLDLPPSSARSLPPTPAHLHDHWPSGSKGEQLLAKQGVYSDSIRLLIDDTASLWNTPHLPASCHSQESGNEDSLIPEPTFHEADSASVSRQSVTMGSRAKPRTKIHLVILTHGLHSNLGADMLYLKESIDAATKKRKPCQNCHRSTDGSTQEPLSTLSDSCGACEHDCPDERVIVRGFHGNAARTERGIQYLGKRLAKYVLLITYPDQPYLPRKKSKVRTYTNLLAIWRAKESNDFHPQSFSDRDEEHLHIDKHNAYQVTSISFIGHSLGGLVQTYAIAYIRKHSPDFFEKIKPVNFVALASPFLGLSNENPVYVRFALDFGLVGRTGQDLGLSWTTPRARSGWEAIMGGKAETFNTERPTHARAKPLLRILPSGPAHEALSKFKNRTLYSNLVNDGIVPLRTSCLLFLDWKGLKRVEKTRRENGIVGTMAEWGWAELTGANSRSPGVSSQINGREATSISAPRAVEQVPLTVDTRRGFSTQSSSSVSSSAGMGSAIQAEMLYESEDKYMNPQMDGPSLQPSSSPLGGLFSIFRLKEPGHKQVKILRRSQTVASPMAEDLVQQDGPYFDHTSSHDTGLVPPPRTTVLESAGDILMPPLPAVDYIVNPAVRPRTILHDRIYHPEDIPPPAVKRRNTAINQHGTVAVDHVSAEDAANDPGLKVEEKIARAYHRGLSWRKVLVRLEPDAHNNIIVRRMFANAYGWPVVQHLVDSHFGPRSSDHLGGICKDSSGSPAPPVEAADNGPHDQTQLLPLTLNDPVA